MAQPQHQQSRPNGDRVTGLLAYGIYLSELYAVVCCLLLLGPWPPWARFSIVVLVAAVAGCGAALVGRRLALPKWTDVVDPGGRVKTGVRSTSRPAGALLAQLTPLAVLALVFPVVGNQLHELNVGGTPLSTVIMAGSIAVPFLAQTACAPLYKALGNDVYNEGSSLLVTNFLARWPIVFIRSLCLVVLLCAAFAATTQWSVGALFAFALFMVCSLAMVQWFVVPIMERRFGLWAVAWLAYAAVLLFAPELCLIAPLATLFVLGISILRGPIFLSLRPTPHVWRTFARGAVQGTLIWLNPLLLLLVTGPSFNPTLVFFSLLPALVLFNSYFTLIAPGIQFGFDSFQYALQKSPVTKLRVQAEYLRAQVRGKFVALGLSFVVATSITMAAESWEPALSSPLYNAMILCSLGFCLESIFVYHLLQLKRDSFVVSFSFAHCVGFAIAMFVFAPTASFYTVNAILQVVIVATLAIVYAREIAEPHYALFWRHATAW